MKLPPAVNLLATAHYLEALDFQREIVKIHTILGGKNPHPNYLVGGVPCPINMNGTGAAGDMINEVTMNYMRDIAKYTVDFVKNVYVPDVKAIASFYPEWFKYGGGISSKNLLSFGEFPVRPNDWSNDNLVMPGGAIVDGNLKEVHPVNPNDPKEIQEFVDPGSPMTRAIRRTSASIRLTVRPFRTSNSRRALSARRPSSAGSAVTASTPGSRPRSGRVTRWKSARSPVS